MYIEKHTSDIVILILNSPRPINNQRCLSVWNFNGPNKTMNNLLRRSTTIIWYNVACDAAHNNEISILNINGFYVLYDMRVLQIKCILSIFLGAMPSFLFGIT